VRVAATFDAVLSLAQTTGGGTVPSTSAVVPLSRALAAMLA
jgi:hypothetical protein